MLRFIYSYYSIIIVYIRHDEERQTLVANFASRMGLLGAQMKRKIIVFVVYISDQRSMRESFFFFFLGGAKWIDIYANWFLCIYIYIRLEEWNLNGLFNLLR